MIGRTLFGLILTIGCLLPVGCAEGPLRRTGHYFPWARDHWDSENSLADTLFERRSKLDQLVTSANAGSDSQRGEVAARLSKIVQNDPILLMRLHAVGALARLESPASVEGLKLASQDPEAEVRIAAVNTWTRFPADIAVGQLQGILGTDTDIDVRLAATKALGSFSGSRAINAVSLALTDPNPAIQYRATEALQNITGERLGANVSQWQNWIASNVAQPSLTPGSSQTRTADGSSSAIENRSRR